MNFTMKILAMSVLLLAMMVLTQATATQRAASSVKVPEKEEESTTGSTADTEDDEGDKSDEDEDEAESTAEENEESGNETSTQGKHEIAKRSLGCHCGWVRYGRRCFRYFPAAKSWAVAQRHCQAMGANLASVHNRNEEYLLRRLARNRIAWIGFSDAQQERYWFWIDGTRVNYVGWARRQPDNYRHRQHCARINWSGARRWDDWYCNYRHGYVCAKRT